MKRILQQFFFACSICLFLANAGASQQVSGESNLAIEVVDASQTAPVRKAFVLIHSATASDRVITLDDKGRSSVSLPPGIYSIFVAAGAFAPSCKEVAIIQGEPQVHLKFKLSPSQFLNVD